MDFLRILSGDEEKPILSGSVSPGRGPNNCQKDVESPPSPVPKCYQKLYHCEDQDVLFTIQSRHFSTNGNGYRKDWPGTGLL